MTLTVKPMSYGVTVVGGTLQYGTFQVTDSTGAQPTAVFPAHFVLNSAGALVDPVTDQTGQAILAAITTQTAALTAILTGSFDIDAGTA